MNTSELNESVVTNLVTTTNSYKNSLHTSLPTEEVCINNELTNSTEFQKQQAKKQKFGFMLVTIGAFIGFISCVLTMVDAIPAMRGFFMYGLTTAAVGVAFYGLYNVFER